jgi:hypothetical protein
MDHQLRLWLWLQCGQQQTTQYPGLRSMVTGVGEQQWKGSVLLVGPDNSAGCWCGRRLLQRHSQCWEA